ncbi:MAG: helix-turn-helix domain-containing protein [Candidatus Omnitrophota bacterium]
MANGTTKQLDSIFHALSDSTRRTILDELAIRDEQSLFEIVVRLIEKHGITLTRQAVSKHLAVLEDADLVRTSWKGRTKLHTNNLPEATRLISCWLQKYKKKGNNSK